MMKLRRLQRQNENDQWYDDAYAYEDSQGRVIFRYNLTWDRIGSTYNGKLQESGVAIESIETILQPGDRFRWLPLELIPTEAAPRVLAELDDACAIPKPRSIADSLKSPLAA